MVRSKAKGWNYQAGFLENQRRYTSRSGWNLYFFDSTTTRAGDRAFTETVFMYGELRADMIDAGPQVTTEEKDIFDNNIVSSSSLASWAPLYRTINYCNLVLDYAPLVKENDPTLTDAQLNAFLAEALALRSFMYFYLVKTFRDVPLKLTSSAKDTDLEQLPKTAGASILAQIVNDLKRAETMAVTSYGSSVSNKGRITKYTVNTILADVYLWMDNYTGCLEQCQKVIDSQLFAMQNANGSWYNNVFYNGSSTETIFELNHQQNTGSVGNAFVNSLSIRKRYLGSSYLISDVFPPDAIDPDRIYDIRADSYFRSFDFAITKWGTESPSYVNWQAYRITDIMLMKAEALTMSAGPVGAGDALLIINDIRLKRGAVDASKETPDATDPDAVIDYILSERAREFAFEGKRWFDLLRVAKRENYRRISVLLDMTSRTVSPLVQQSSIAKFRDVNSHYLPIADSELFADPLLIQNPFYTK
jgi:hypothetical protein